MPLSFMSCYRIRMRSAIITVIAFVFLGLGITAAYASSSAIGMGGHLTPQNRLRDITKDNISVAGTVAAVDISTHTFVLDRQDPFTPGATVRLRIAFDGSGNSSVFSGPDGNTLQMSSDQISSNLLGAQVRVSIKNQPGTLGADRIILPQGIKS